MTCSPERLAANRQNALRSTGPRTDAGKARSRGNATRHGLAGRGDLPAPGDDRALIDQRTVLFGRELGATGELGALLAHRAAVLSVRMEQATDRNLHAEAVAAEAGRAEFDADHEARVVAWIAALDGPDDPAEALARLALTPEGIGHLAGAWRAIRAEVAAGSEVAAARAARWLGRDPADPAGAADLLAAVDAECACFDGDRGALAYERASESLAADRYRAGLVASFEAGPDAALARRYEAAAERGMYRAIRAIAQLRQGQAAEAVATPPALGPAAAPTPDRPQPEPALPPAPAPAPAPLDVRIEPVGSFGAGTLAPPAERIEVAAGRPDRSSSPAEAPRKRPDLRRLLAKRR